MGDLQGDAAQPGGQDASELRHLDAGPLEMRRDDALVLAQQATGGGIAESARHRVRQGGAAQVAVVARQTGHIL